MILVFIFSQDIHALCYLQDQSMFFFLGGILGDDSLNALNTNRKLMENIYLKYMIFACKIY
jgi:hypothetical protein